MARHIPTLLLSSAIAESAEQQLELGGVTISNVALDYQSSQYTMVKGLGHADRSKTDTT